MAELSLIVGASATCALVFKDASGSTVPAVLGGAVSVSDSAIGSGACCGRCLGIGHCCGGRHDHGDVHQRRSRRIDLGYRQPRPGRLRRVRSGLVMRLAALLLALMCGGCAASPALVGAALGFGASALKLDDDLLIWYLQQKGSLPQSGGAGVSDVTQQTRQP
jgi:hypothetical protein